MKTEFIERLRTEVKLEILGRLKTSNDHHRLKCLLCDNIFKATPKSKLANFKKSGMAGCPTCTRTARYKDIVNVNVKKLQQTFDFKTPSKFNNDTMLHVVNKTCGHSFTAKVGNLLNRNVQCPKCSKIVKKDMFKMYNNQRHHDSLLKLEGLDRYRQGVRALTEYNYRSHKDIINPDKLERKRSGTDGYHLDHIISIKYCFEHNIPEEVCADVDNLRMVEWRVNATKWSHPMFIIPKIFYMYLPHSTIINEFISSFPNLQHQIELVSPYIFDLYDPINKIAVVFHIIEDITESKVSGKKYSVKLRERCASQGVRVIQVFSDEWVKNPTLVKCKIDHIMGASNDTTTVYARKTTIREISGKEKNAFLDANHIQGHDTSQINIGSYYNDKLISVMTFCKPRVLMSNDSNSVGANWELSRFAVCNDIRATGIGSKLLSHFKKNYAWDSIYSYADLRWSDMNNNVYEHMGFTLDKKRIAPEYYYIIAGVRKHRWGYRKDMLRKKFPDSYDVLLTEYSNMRKLGYDRVWGAGILKYILTNLSSHVV